MESASTLRRDIISAYMVTGSRVLAWIIVIAGVYRVAGRPAFAVLTLIQTTIGVLEYTALGLAPAIIHLTSDALRNARAQFTNPTREQLREPARIVYANGFAMALLTAGAAAILLVGFLIVFHHLHPAGQAPPPPESNEALYLRAFDLSIYVGIATIFRMMSDAPGAALQTSHHIFTDNVLLTLAEAIWTVGTILGLFVFHLPWQAATGIPLAIGALTLLVFRGILSHQNGSGLFDHWWQHVRGATLKRLLTFGLMVVGAQMADYLYAPTNYIIIANLLGPIHLADYSPAVTIDGGVLMLVTAIATTLLPRTALAHAAGNSQTVRRYYIRGTLATAALLLAAAPIVWLIAPFMFRIWLHDPMTRTCEILPLILIHTVIGGSSAVGRSILLAIGRVRPFTISVVIGGICNVILGLIFVHYFHWGLKGIVLGTIIAVSGRCIFWLPWYTLWAIRQGEIEPPAFEIVDTMPPAPMH